MVRVNYENSFLKNGFLLFAAFFIGLLIGGFKNSTNYIKHENDFEYFQYQPKRIIELVETSVDPANIQRHLKYLTSIPHLAGTEGGKLSAKYVKAQWEKQGLDVQTSDYNVLLDHPDDVKYNSITIINENDTIDKVYEIKEDVLGNSKLDFTKITKPFLAYGLNGSFEFTEVFFLNYCGENDFKLFLDQNKQVNLRDKIVLCKYGHVFRGNKIGIAEKYGAKSVLLYDDPYRCAPYNQTMNSSERIFPRGEFMPELGTQRGTVYVREGDPLTPCYPSIESAYKVTNPKIPGIAAQVIGYKIAEEIFNLIESSSKLSPENWHGQMKVRYSFGGKLINNRKLLLKIFNKKELRQITNISGFIKGLEEPDRYVIIGNHRDSWTYGSMDPSFGTSVMLEVSRVLNGLKNNNKWMPRRSLLFMSWDAEEYGLVGSTEWVEEFEKKLSANGVVYINMDVSVYGNYSYEAIASPLLNEILFSLTKKIKVSSNESAYDRWLANDKDKETGLPNISPFLGSGSDHMAFLQRAGIPCMDQKVGRKKNDILSKRMGSSYPLYHTSYETFELVNEIIDPGFVGAKTLAQIVTAIGHSLATSTILPFNSNTYAQVLTKEFKKFKNSYRNVFEKLNISLNGLDYAVKNFSVVSNKFMKRVKLLKLHNNQNMIRQINEQFRSLERAFLDYNSLESRGYMHTIFAPSILDKYTSEVFPTLVDIINDCDDKCNKNELAEQIKLKLSVIIYSILSACSVLREPGDFQRYVF